MKIIRFMPLLAAAPFILLACSNAERLQDTQTTCESEAVIMVVAGKTLDRARMGQYAKAIADAGLYPKANGYYLNVPRPIEVFEGNVADNHATLMVRFPSLEAARTFWNSDEYQNEIKPLRLNPPAGDYTVTVYKEAELPLYMKDKVGSHGYICD